MDNNMMQHENYNETTQELTIGKKEKKSSTFRIIIDVALFVLIALLFVLYFFGKQKNSEQPTQQGVLYTYEPGTGEVVYVNVDTINEHYELISILTDDITAETAKQESIFANRQKALEAKAAQFQRNYESGTLSNAQIQNGQAQLMKESETLQQEYEEVANGLQMRQLAAMQQMNDSLRNAIARVNTVRNASFVLSYQAAGGVLYADPSKEITSEVLEELNRSYKNSSKK